MLTVSACLQYDSKYEDKYAPKYEDKVRHTGGGKRAGNHLPLSQKV